MVYNLLELGLTTVTVRGQTFRLGDVVRFRRIGKPDGYGRIVYIHSLHAGGEDANAQLAPLGGDPAGKPVVRAYVQLSECELWK